MAANGGFDVFSFPDRGRQGNFGSMDDDANAGDLWNDASSMGIGTLNTDDFLLGNRAGTLSGSGQTSPYSSSPYLNGTMSMMNFADSGGGNGGPSGRPLMSQRERERVLRAEMQMPRMSLETDVSGGLQMRKTGSGGNGNGGGPWDSYRGGDLGLGFDNDPLSGGDFAQMGGKDKGGMSVLGRGAGRHQGMGGGFGSDELNGYGGKGSDYAYEQELMLFRDQQQRMRGSGGGGGGGGGGYNPRFNGGGGHPRDGRPHGHHGDHGDHGDYDRNGGFRRSPPDHLRRDRGPMGGGSEDDAYAPLGEFGDAAGGCPAEYRCPISMKVMSDPVIAGDGFSYERASIEQWMQTSHGCVA